MYKEKKRKRLTHPLSDVDRVEPSLAQLLGQHRVAQVRPVWQRPRDEIGAGRGELERVPAGKEASSSWRAVLVDVLARELEPASSQDVQLRGLHVRIVVPNACARGEVRVRVRVRDRVAAC